MAFDSEYAKKHTAVMEKRKLYINLCVKSITEIFLQPYILIITGAGLLLKLFLNSDGFLLGIGMSFVVVILSMIIIGLIEELKYKKELGL
jgi:hypothetical protein